jgi:hypothetical protein
MPALRRSDTLWLRLAALREEPFADGVPWQIAPTRFAELERRGLRAVATEPGRERLAKLKHHLLSRKGVAHG